VHLGEGGAMLKRILSLLGLEIVVESGKLLNASDRQKIYFVSLIQFALNLLDLAGVALIGILGAVSISGIQSQQPGSSTVEALRFLNIETLSVQSQAAFLGILATVLFVSRTIISIFITRRYIFFLSRKGSEVTLGLLDKILKAPILSTQERSVQETIFALTEGIKALTLGVLATAVALFSDFSLMIVLAIALFTVDLTIAISAIVLFGAVGIVLHKLMTRKSQAIGKLVAADSVKLNEEYAEVLNSLRESFVLGTRPSYFKRASRIRNRLAISQAEIQFMPNISKYVVEMSLIVGALTIAAIQFSTKDAVQAVATLSVFMAAGSRIGPAVLRVQQGIIQIRSSIGIAESSISFLGRFGNTEILRRGEGDHSSGAHLARFIPEIEVKEVSYRYPGSSNYSLTDISFIARPGDFIAIAGPSGAGKSTLADLLLGILEPNSGLIQVSGLKPEAAIKFWPRKVSYVPQDVFVSSSDLRSNVALGVESEDIDDRKVINALEKAQLLEFLDSLTDGIYAFVGEQGSKLSGGQKQRLGIARALYNNPEVIILDEATSSLDTDTESEITATLMGLKGETTLIVIAHRVTTIKEADLIVFLENGIITAQGSFEEVSREKKNFR